MSERPGGIPPASEPAPRESASGVVLRRGDDDHWEVLLGLRSRKARFMPGHLCFPGGGLETRDGSLGPAALARCASRELAEEAGVVVAPGNWAAAGERTTPPMFPVRFRNHFFVAAIDPATSVPRQPPSPAEIEQLRMARPAVVLEEWARGECRIPPPVLPILRAMVDAAGAGAGELARRIAAVNALEQRAPRIEFAPGTWMLPVRTATLPPATHTNVWMPGGRRFAIIDPGADGAADLGRLFDVIERRREQGQTPDCVLLTHHHRDHVCGFAKVARQLELPVRAHPETLRLLDSRQSAAVEFLPTAESAEIDLDGIVLRAVHTPGHAAGHLVFLVVGRGQLIAGDLISGMSTILIDPAEGEMEAYLASLERARALDFRLLLPGHGPPLPASALDKLLTHRREREHRILAKLGNTAIELAQIAAGAYEDAPEMPSSLTERQTLAHLIHLERQGLARRLDVDARTWARA